MSNKLILGTVQFGLNYGINNSTGQPPEGEVFEILDEANRQGIELLDTADSYGNAIDLIGYYHQKCNNRFKVLSKFKSAEVGELAEKARIALSKLDIPAFEVYSYHSFINYSECHYLREELLLLKQQGLIKKIGISVYTNDEFQRVIDDDLIEVIQLPYNLLDNQNLRGNLINQAKAKGKEIHTRSVYLQGLFFLKIDALPQNLLPLKPYLQDIHSFCKKESFGMETLALSYVLFNEHISHVLIGVDTKEQLIKNLSSSKEITSAFNFINDNIHVKETALLNPANWN